MSTKKDTQLQEFTVDAKKQGPILTSQTGVRINHTDDSLKAGPRGNTLLEDFHFREKITHFDHERIPERVVHARGSGAHGYFELYKSQAHLTRAKFLCDTSRKTPVFVRFSTVLGSRGNCDTVRDVRGFATRFYTDEGNFDLVGNNIPVFFIQDAIKFPDIIHAGKPEPHNEIPQGQTAHDNFWDFISLMPESMHMIMWALSDRAIPRSYRMMQGFGVHSFVLVNAEGVRRFVKFHWRPKLGTHGLVWDEALKLGGQDPDFHRRDLYDAINSGNFPEWELGLQIVEEKDEDSFDFDILDATKIIPEELVPVQIVGKMTLNRNPAEFFTETEQIAYCTQNIVDGIDFSNDPLLQGRNFSYLDTQLIRLGGPNFNDLPINRPVCPVFNNQRDGYMRYPINPSKVNYFPNRFGCPVVASAAEGGFVSYAEKIAGMKARTRGPKFQERYNQATLFFNSLTPIEKDHLVAAACFELGKCEEEGTHTRMLDHFNHIEPELARRFAEGMGLPVPEPIPGWKNHGQTSPALSMLNTAKGVATRKVAILVANGFDGKEVTELQKLLKAAGTIPAIVGPSRTTITSDSGEQVKVDFPAFTVKSTLFDSVFVPGGAKSVATLKANGDILGFVTEAFKHCKAIAASGEGIDVILRCALPGVKVATKEDKVESQGVVTGSKVAGVVPPFLAELGNHRHWARDVAGVPI